MQPWKPSTPDLVTDEESWEQRRYWTDGALVDSKWWKDGVLWPEGSGRMPAEVQTRDYCAQHRSPIYPDLGCQVCRQRPGRSRS